MAITGSTARTQLSGNFNDALGLIPETSWMRSRMGTRSSAVRRPFQVPKRTLTEELLPTNLPTGKGSYSPFQRLGSPRENVSRGSDASADSSWAPDMVGKGGTKPSA